LTDSQAIPGKTSLPDVVHSPLREPNFRWLWFNNIGYFIVVNAQRFVFAWFVLDGLNKAERDQGLVVFALGIPALFLVVQAGAWADRLDRRNLLLVTQLGAAAVTSGTAILTGTGQATLTWILLAAVLAGSAGSIGQPVRASLIPQLVSEAQLFKAIAFNALAMTSSMIFGPVLAKVVGDQFGFEGAFWFQTILLLAGVSFLLQMRIPPHEHVSEDTQSVYAATRAAVDHVLGDRSLRTLFLLLTVSGFTINPAVMVTLQAFVKTELKRDSGDTGLLFATMGLGIAISSVIVMRKGDMKGKGSAFQRAMMVGSTMTFIMGFTTEFVQLFPLVLIMGLAGGFYITMNQGLIQANTPQPLMGRVMGLYTLIQAGLLPVGALILGLIASKIGAGATMSYAAAIGFTIVVVTYLSNSEFRKLS